MHSRLLIALGFAAVAFGSAHGASVCWDGLTSKKGFSGRCTWYEDDSCCTMTSSSGPLLGSVSKLGENPFSNIREKAACRLETGCRDALALFGCAGCSPNSKEFLAGGKLSICKDFAQDLYDSCAKSEFDDPVGVNCIRVVDMYTSMEMFVESFNGTLVVKDDACFSAASKDMSAVSIVMVAIGVALLVRA